MVAKIFLNNNLMQRQFVELALVNYKKDLVVVALLLTMELFVAFNKHRYYHLFLQHLLMIIAILTH
jgi:hypothetical protein